MKRSPTLFHHIRKAAGLRQEDVAEKLEVTQATVSRWDTGTVAVPPEKLAQLRTVIGLDATPETTRDATPRDNREAA